MGKINDARLLESFFLPPFLCYTFVRIMKAEEAPQHEAAFFPSLFFFFPRLFFLPLPTIHLLRTENAMARSALF